MTAVALQPIGPLAEKLAPAFLHMAESTARGLEFTLSAPLDHRNDWNAVLRIDQIEDPQLPVAPVEPEYLAGQLNSLAASVILAGAWPEDAGAREDLARALVGAMFEKYGPRAGTFVRLVANAAGDPQAVAYAELEPGESAELGDLIGEERSARVLELLGLSDEPADVYQAPDTRGPEPEGAVKTEQGEQPGEEISEFEDEKPPSELGGHIRLFRRVLQNPVFTVLDAGVFKVFVAALLLARWKRTKWYDGAREVEIGRGSFVTSYAKMAARCNLSVKQVRTAFKHLDNLHIAAFKRAGRYTIVTLVNYGAYQPSAEMKGIQNGSTRAGAGQGQGAGRVGARQGHDRGTTGATTEEGKEGIKKGKKEEDGQLALTESESSPPPGETAMKIPSIENPPFGTLDKRPKRKHREHDAEVQAWFDAEFWPRYPRHKAEEDARTAADKAARDPLMRAVIMAGLERLLPELLADPTYIPYAATWLNGKRWKDEPQTSPVVAGSRSVDRHALHSQRVSEAFDDLLTERLTDAT